MKNKYVKWIVRTCIQILVAVLSLVGFSIFFKGMYLIGVPAPEDVQKAVISYPQAEDEAKEVTDPKQVELAVKLTGFLRYSLFEEADEREQPLITIEYHGNDGRVTAVSANRNTVWWKGKARVIKDPDLFINLTEGIFFLDDLAAAKTAPPQPEAGVRAAAGGIEYELYQLISADYGYVGDGSFASGSGPRLHNLLSDGETEELPVIKWNDDFSLIVPDEVELNAIEVLNREGERLFGFYPETISRYGEELAADGFKEYRKYFSELPEGTYYVAAEVYREGDYIQEYDQYECSVEQYVFCMEK